MKNIYQALKKAGVKLDSHESDLYAERTDISTKLLKEYEYKKNVKTFKNQKDGKTWFDLPFAYNPFWKSKLINR